MKLSYVVKKSYEANLIVSYDHIIHKLCDDSKLVEPGDVFFAIEGYKKDGKTYVEEAIKNGAKTIVYQGDLLKEHLNINYFCVNNIKKTRAKFAQIFFHDITKKVQLIGVTGTNGKTTISTILMDFFSYLGMEACLIGTNGIHFKDQHFHTENTTPSLLTTLETIYECYRKGATHIIMEVSSIGIRELRTMYFDFDVLIFTNFSQDHLDYHENMTDYRFSKALLFSEMLDKKNKIVILNCDDDSYQFFNQMSKCPVITYGVKYKADYQATNIIKNLHETKFRLLMNHQKYDIKSSFIGSFNVYNILAVIACIQHYKLSIEEFIDFLRIYVNVRGRMDIIKYDSKTIIIDFAHTPVGVETVLKTLKEYDCDQLTVIIGCGGNRDKLKRPMIGMTVMKYADKIIFTNDNPRDETPEEIILDITRGLPKKSYQIILDRKKAIYTALEESVPNEIIAILGKGSERSQIIAGIKYPFNDKEVVRTYIRRKSNEN